MIFLGPASRGPAKRPATPAREPWDLEGATFLTTIEAEGLCDGSHGRFCPECASINREWGPPPISTKGA